MWEPSTTSSSIHSLRTLSQRAPGLCFNPDRDNTEPHFSSNMQSEGQVVCCSHSVYLSPQQSINGQIRPHRYLSSTCQCTSLIHSCDSLSDILGLIMSDDLSLSYCTAHLNVKRALRHTKATSSPNGPLSNPHDTHAFSPNKASRASTDLPHESSYLCKTNPGGPIHCCSSTQPGDRRFVDLGPPDCMPLHCCPHILMPSA